MWFFLCSCWKLKRGWETHKPRHQDSKTKTLRHRDSGTKTPRHRETKTIKPRYCYPKAFFQRTKSHDIKIPNLKNQDIQIPRLKSHDIEFLRNSDPCSHFPKTKQKKNKNECYTLVLMILAKSVLADSINNIVQGTIT